MTDKVEKQKYLKEMIVDQGYDAMSFGEYMAT